MDKYFKRKKNNFFERDLYKDLIDWKEGTNKVLFLKGPRQVGKTYLLKKIGKEQFKRVIYVDLTPTQENSNRFLNICKEVGKLGEFKSTDEDKMLFWLNVFTIYDNNFIDDKDTLIIIDEVQESSSIYNSIREFNRNLRSRVAVAGSYLGIAQFKEDFRESAGDTKTLELNPLSYIEFLKAVGIYSEYYKIKTIEKSDLTEEELEIYDKVEEYYEIYCEIGGYPDVIKEYLDTKDINKCKGLIGGLLLSFYRESNSYLNDIIDSTLFDKTLQLTIQDLISKTNNLQEIETNMSFRENINDTSITRKEKNRCLSWLVACNILGKSFIYSDFKNIKETDSERYYFKDMGMLAYICDNIASLQQSDISGIKSENFVYLYLNDNTRDVGVRKGIMKETKVFSFHDKNRNLEIDFLLHLESGNRVAIEVKSQKGKVKSSDIALGEGNISYIIKLVKRYGGVDGNKITIPIFAITKLKAVLSQLQ